MVDPYFVMPEVPALNDPLHENPEKHMIGITLPSAEQVKGVAITGSVGVSPIPAREDHVHGVGASAYAVSSGTLALVAAAADVPGATVTLNSLKVGDRVEVTACFSFQKTGATVNTAVGTLDVNGAAQAAQCLLRYDAAVFRASLFQQWDFVVAAAGNHTFKLRGNVNVAGVGYLMDQTHCTIRAKLVSAV